MPENQPETDSRPATSPFTRRRLLGGAAAGGAALASLALPGNVRKALADPMPVSRHSSVRDIKHVVLLMQENRSFDHYFGTMPGVRGFGDPRAMIQKSGPQAGKSIFYQPDPGNPDGYLLPYHLDTLTTGAQAIPSTSHAWNVQHSALNNGANNNWVPAHYAADGKNGPFTMGYYERQDIPFQRALAEAFTICDSYHCGVLGPTHPNRYMWLTGTIDPTGSYGGPALDNAITDGRYHWPTYAEALTEAGVSWKCYQESDIPPPIPPAGTPGEYVTVATSPGGTASNDLWVGPGFRVPCIIVSPWTAGGWVFSEPSDHTSHLRFLEAVTGVTAPNISAWRRSQLSDLTGAFRFGSRAEPPVLPDTSGPLTVAKYTSSAFPLPPFPGADQTPPFQPPGRRPHVG